MQIFITGSISFDEIMDFPQEFKDYFHPEKLHQINVSFVVNRLKKQLGGTATNIAYNTSLIFNLKFKIFNQYQITNNKNKVVILGAVGKDGQPFLQFFKKNKIDTSNTVVDNKLYTSTGKVITDIKDNQIWGFYYGASIAAKKINLKRIVSRVDLLILSPTHKDAFLNFQNQAIKNKIPYLYDPGMALTWIDDKNLKKGVLNAKYLIGNDYEMAMILKRTNYSVDELASRGLRVITTLGEKGVIYSSNVKTEKIFVPAYKVKNVVDPTGAGDAWRGGFAAGLASELKIQDCLKLGNVMASFAIEKYGTVNHRPSKLEVEKRLKTL